jgi:Ras-related protein Rab-5C
MFSTKNNSSDLTYKVVTLGSSGVGKTSLMVRLVHEAFVEDQSSTIGASFLIKKMNLGMVDMANEAKEVTYNLVFEIFDTAGQERYESLAPLYYRSANVAIIIYDVTNRESWDRAKRWVTTIEEVHVGIEPILIVVLGNKIDIGKEGGEEQGSREVSTQELKDFVSGTQHLSFETSAKISGTVDDNPTTFVVKNEQIGTSMATIFLQIAMKLLEKERSKPENMVSNKSLLNYKRIESDSIFKRLFSPCSVL